MENKRRGIRYLTPFDSEAFKGSHRVSFTFCPAGLREGLLITAASGAVGILGVLVSFLRSRVKSNGRR